MNAKLSTALILAVTLLAGCMMPPATRAPVRAQQAPCGPGAAPISNATLYVSIPVNFNYTPKDRPNGTQEVRQFVLDRLNQLGKAQNNTFYLQNGPQLNFTFTFNYNNNNEIFTGGMQFSGWGQGDLHYYSTSGQYNDPFQMAQDLTDQAYTFIRDGWHDSRPQCAAR